MTNPDQPDAGRMPTCYRHPARETGISCQRCGKPICPDCMRDAAVGFHCPDCVKIGAAQTRQGLAMYGGKRSADARLTSFVLIGLNAIIWLAITVTGGGGSRLADLLSLRPNGVCAPGDGYVYDVPASVCSANFLPGVADGAWWQILTSAFTHVQIWHIAMNMLALFVLGPPLEQILGRARFLGVYFVSALAGSVTVLWLAHPLGATLGASGAIFGMLGALLVTFRKARLDTSGILQNIGLGVVITVVGWQYISWQGHLGGLLGGAAAALVIAHAPKANRSLVQWGGLSLLVVVLLALAAVRVASLA